MKKIIALLLALMMIFALAACNNNDYPNGDDPLNRDPGTSQTDNQGGTQGGEDNPGTQGGDDGSAKLDKFNEEVRAMPESTDKNEIKSAVKDVFDINIDLPDGSYSAQAMSAESGTAYVVYVSGSNMTAANYYNSIKAQMTADGYTAIDEDLAFYKAVDGLLYNVGLDSEGRDFYNHQLQKLPRLSKRCRRKTRNRPRRSRNGRDDIRLVPRRRQYPHHQIQARSRRQTLADRKDHVERVHHTLDTHQRKVQG